MTNQATLLASERTASRSGVDSSLKVSAVPANLFTCTGETLSLSVNRRDLQKMISLDGVTQVILLRVGELPAIRVALRHVQHNPITGQIVHVDFYEVA